MGSSANPMVLFALWTVFPIGGRAQDDICRSKVCKVVAEVFDQTVNTSLDPCNDFFTYVCAGWMDIVKKKLGARTGGEHISNSFAIKKGVFPAILLKELKRLRRKILRANSSIMGVRDSEMQPVMFFESCLRFSKKNNWDFSILTLRKFFHEVGLPFFDEELNNCTDKTPLTALVKLALQFGISPFFTVQLRGSKITVMRSSVHPDQLIIGSDEEPRVIAERWKNALLLESRNTANDSRILAEFGAVFDAFHIRAREVDLLKWGRSYQAVKRCYETVFEEPVGDLDWYNLHEWSEAANSTYFDLLDQNTGNFARLDRNHTIQFSTHFFEPFLILIRDQDVSQIFTDYIRVHLLRNEFIAPLRRTECALQGKACTDIVGETHFKYCARLVSSHPAPWSFARSASAAHVQRAFHHEKLRLR